jgi:hypothetical protein
MSVNLWDEVRSIGGELSAESEGESSEFGIVMIVIGVVEIASGGVGIDVAEV